MSEKKTIDAQNTFTDWVRPTGKQRESLVTVLLSPTSLTGTVTIQARLKDDVTDIFDLHSETSPAADVAKNVNIPGDFEVRAGIKTGDYSSGSVTIAIGGADRN